MSVQFSVLASSSAANCAVIATEGTRILVDAGLSKKACFARLAAVGIKPESLSGICCSHNHMDHAGHAASIARSLNIPVHMSKGTAEALKLDCQVKTFDAGKCFEIGDISVQTYATPHDAAEPVGFSFSVLGAWTCSVVTDLGWIPDDVAQYLVGSDVLMIESNACTEMLRVGPHPHNVKMRVTGQYGHLSNEQVAEFITKYLDARCTTLILAHLSSSSNHPVIAESMASRALAEKGLSPRLLIANGKEPVSVLW